MRIELYIQGIKVKMFDKDETIKINRKVKDYRNIEKIFSDYSESFTLPGEANNALFKHYYDADNDGTFDARIKQPAQIYLDQELFKDGVIQLKNVQIKNNKVDNYKVQFFTQLTQLIETFGEDELNDLDLSEFNHDYTYENVKLGLTSGLFGGDIIYPLISYVRRFIYNLDIASGNDTDTLINIADNGSTTPVGFSYKELKPAIKVNRIFDAIQNFYSLNFLGDIFNSADLENLYMNLVNNEADDKATTSILADSFVLLIDPFPALTLVSIGMLGRVFVDTGFEAVPLQIQLLKNGIVLGTSDVLIPEDDGFNPPTNYGVSFGINFTVPTILGNYQMRILSAQPLDISSSQLVVQAAYSNGSLETLYEDFVTNLSITPTLEVALQFQEFKIKDFVKAFVKAFNLVVIPQNETDILFQPLQDWYTDGNIIDITDYTDNQDLEVKPGELISGVDFKYDKNDTYLSAIIKEDRGKGFGNLDLEFVDDNDQKLTGELLEVTLPFEKPVFEKISPNTVYGFFVNRQQEEFNPFHSIFYTLTLSGSPINIKQENGTIENVNSYICPITSENPQGSLATNFEIEKDEYINVNSNITFYTKYWKDYVDDLFSIRRRNYNLEARLPLEILRTIELNDRLIIGQRRYVINSYQADLMTQEVKLDLFNDIFEGNLNNEIPNIVIRQSTYVISGLATEVEFNLISNFNIDLVTASDVGWTTSFNGKIGKVQVSENTTGLAKVETITIRDTDGNSVFGYITQLPIALTADTTTITADTNLITSDNG